MSEQLTQKQKIVLDALRSFIAREGHSPTLKELGVFLKTKKMKMASLNGPVQYLKALEGKGYVQRFPRPRGIRLLEGNIKNFVEIPLVGNADCGEPLSFADDQVEDYINVSKKIIRGDKKDYFFVKAVGDSMDREGINNNDYVLARKTHDVENGANVLAVINGLGTIKKVRKDNDKLVLMPSSTNPKHKPIVLHPEDDVLICGKVERVIKSSTE